MGAIWLKNKLLGMRAVIEVSSKNDFLCEAVLSGANNALPKTIRIYVPRSSEADTEYLLSQELVARAVTLQATHIAYEQWIEGVTTAAEIYARRNNISIMPVGDFLSKVENGEYP